MIAVQVKVLIATGSRLPCRTFSGRVELSQAACTACTSRTNLRRLCATGSPAASAPEPMSYLCQRNVKRYSLMLMLLSMLNTASAIKSHSSGSQDRTSETKCRNERWDCSEVSSSGRPLHTLAPATGSARSQTVKSRDDRTMSYWSKTGADIDKPSATGWSQRQSSEELRFENIGTSGSPIWGWCVQRHEASEIWRANYSTSRMASLRVINLTPFTYLTGRSHVTYLSTNQLLSSM